MCKNSFIPQIKSGEVEAGLNELLEKVRINSGLSKIAGKQRQLSGEGGLRRRWESEGEEEEQEQGVQLQVHWA